MRLPLFIALRYIFSKKSRNVINIISSISILGISVGAFALIVILSIFNGFGNLAESLYDTFYADLKVSSAEGKTWVISPEELKKIAHIEGVVSVAKTLEEIAYLKYKQNEMISYMKGVDSNYVLVSQIDSFITLGSYLPAQSNGSIPNAVLGAGIQAHMHTLVEGRTPLQIWIPKRGRQISFVPSQIFNRGNARIAGIFRVQKEFDVKYVLVPLAFAQKLLQYRNGEIGALEIRVKNSTFYADVKDEIQSILGERIMVKNKYEQNQSLYQILKIERWAVIALLSFIMVIISFNIIGSLSILVKEKDTDIYILKSLGMQVSQIQKIFVLNGFLSALIGGLIGISLGLVLCGIQMTFGIIKLPHENFVVEAYPVYIKLSDIFISLAIVLLISGLAAWLPAIRAAQKAKN